MSLVWSRRDVSGANRSGPVGAPEAPGEAARSELDRRWDAFFESWDLARVFLRKCLEAMEDVSHADLVYIAPEISTPSSATAERIFETLIAIARVSAFRGTIEGGAYAVVAELRQAFENAAKSVSSMCEFFEDAVGRPVMAECGAEVCAGINASLLSRAFATSNAALFFTTLVEAGLHEPGFILEIKEALGKDSWGRVKKWCVSTRTRLIVADVPK